MTTVVKQRINRLLKHALFIPNNHIRRLQLQKIPQTVIPVDYAAIKIVQIGGRKTSTFQRHQRTQIRRDYGKHLQNHPLGTGLACGKPLNQFQALRQLLTNLLGSRSSHCLFELFLEPVQIGKRKQFANRLSSHPRLEITLTVSIQSITVFILREKLPLLERRLPWVNHKVILVINDPLELAARHIEHQADARRHALIKPDVRHRH